MHYANTENKKASCINLQIKFSCNKKNTLFIIIAFSICKTDLT